MPSIFNKSSVTDIGTSFQTIYTCPANTTAVVIGLTITNNIGTDIEVQAQLHDNFFSVETDLISDTTPVQVGSSVVVAGTIQKICLRESDTIQVKSSDVASADAFISVLEIN